MAESELTTSNTEFTSTRFFNAVDKIDRQFYGKRMNYLINGALIILIAAPLVNWWLEVPHYRLTYYSTLVYLIFLVTLVLGWASTFRDEDGQWTFKKIAPRLITYYQIIKDAANETKTNSRDELLYMWAIRFILFGIIYKAFHNLSIFARKPIEHFTGAHLTKLRHFEHSAHRLYWIPIVLGAITLIWLYDKNPNILVRIKHELNNLFGKRDSAGDKYQNEIAKIETANHIDLILNAKEQDHMEVIITRSKNLLFNDFALALKNWHPKNYEYEYQFQDALLRYLKKTLPRVSIETEKPIGEPGIHNKGRADMVINDTILIEMKKDTSAGAVQWAKGQIMQYSHIWKDKGPVILLLCNYEYDHAKLSFTSTMQDLLKLERTALTFVARKN